VTEIGIRPAKASDQAYVATSWHRRCGEKANLVDWALDRRGARVLVACPVDNQDRIEGWLCYEHQPAAQLVHQVYVRAERRRQGIATRMLQNAKLDNTRTLVVTSITLPPWETRWRIIRMDLSELAPLELRRAGCG